MTIRQLQLIAPIAMTGTAAPYLIVPPTTTYRIGRLGFANNTGAPVSVHAYLVPSGGTPTSANLVLPPVNVANGTTYPSPELAGLTLPQGSKLYASGNGVVLYASGIAVT